VGPSLSVTNVADVDLAHSVFLGEYALGDSAGLTDREYVCLTQLGERVLHASCAASVRLTALRHLIRHVVGVGPEKQVLGVNAASIIAAMENLHPIGDGTKVECVREPVREPASAVLLEDCIPVLVFLPKPIPASSFAVYVNSSIEEVFKRYRVSNHRH
jgi:hypothetical protein